MTFGSGGTGASESSCAVSYHGGSPGGSPDLAAVVASIAAGTATPEQLEAVALAGLEHLAATSEIARLVLEVQRGGEHAVRAAVRLAELLSESSGARDLARNL